METNVFEPYTLEKYNFYKEFSSENQFYNIIQREHYLDHGCICNSCCYKRRQIFLMIKNGHVNVDTKIIHEQAVQEKKNRKVQRIGNICNKIQDKLNEISKIQKRTKIYNTLDIKIK
jgi:hypothetical protein